MKPLELLRDLHAAGARVDVVGSDLRVRAPKGVLTDGRREMLRAEKQELVKLLSTYSCVGCGRFSFKNPGTRCYWCQKPPAAA
ncbi:MAG: hypothetical protein ACRENK_16980 [Gemmatimonadaceae bacterium]